MHATVLLLVVLLVGGCCCEASVLHHRPTQQHKQPQSVEQPQNGTAAERLYRGFLAAFSAKDIVWFAAHAADDISMRVMGWAPTGNDSPSDCAPIVGKEQFVAAVNSTLGFRQYGVAQYTVKFAIPSFDRIAAQATFAAFIADPPTGSSPYVFADNVLHTLRTNAAGDKITEFLEVAPFSQQATAANMTRAVHDLTQGLDRRNATLFAQALAPSLKTTEWMRSAMQPAPVMNYSTTVSYLAEEVSVEIAGGIALAGGVHVACDIAWARLVEFLDLKGNAGQGGGQTVNEMLTFLRFEDLWTTGSARATDWQDFSFITP